jgi:glycosyltransferase involved in cell wall biosynthesis
MVFISILICTRNRAGKLRRVLDRVISLRVPSGVECEVLVVDNGSTDGTHNIIEEVAATAPFSIRRIWHPKLGKSDATNRAITEARGTIVGVLDDDVLPAEDWLEVIRQEFLNDPALSAISGRVELEDQLDLPVGIRRNTDRSEIHTLEDVKTRCIGCNLAIRRDAIPPLRPFDPNLGPGCWIPSNEDVDFFYRLLRSGKKIVFVPALFVHHFHGRRTKREEQELGRAYVIGRGAFYAKFFLRGDMLVLRSAYWEASGLVRSPRNGNSRTPPKFVLWLLEGALRQFLVTLRAPFTS